MASVVINGDTSGGITLSAPAVAGSNTYTLAPATGNITPIVSGTAIASTSGTSVDFVLSSTIAPYVKRVTVMFSGVSTSGTSNYLVQIGDSGGFKTTGYASTNSAGAGGVITTTSTNGHLIASQVAATALFNGHLIFTLVSSNVYVGSSTLLSTGNNGYAIGASNVTLTGALDRVRITTANGTDTFDAGTINIMYEG